MEQLYRRLLEFTRDGVYRYTLSDGTILLANPGLVRILDLDCEPEELVGRRLRDVMVYTEREGLVREAMHETGEVRDFEYHFKTLKGGDRWVLHDSFIREDPFSGAPCVEAIVRDITARKKREERIRRRHDTLDVLVKARTAELRRSNEELERFAYVASHDLQEPLRKIVFFGGRVQRHAGLLPPEAGEDLGRVLNAATRMQRLIEDLLALSRISRKALPFEPVDLDRVAGDVVADLEARIGESGATVEVGPLPRVEAEPTHMRQLLQNLIGNALKFHKPGVPPVVRVRGRVREEDGGASCELVVEDEGIGFEPKYAAQLFGVFQRLHPRGEYEGTGIGLAICGKIAEYHGGRIEAHGESDRGARFTVTLPVRQRREAPHDEEQAES